MKAINAFQLQKSQHCRRYAVLTISLSRQIQYQPQQAKAQPKPKRPYVEAEESPEDYDVSFNPFQPWKHA